MDFDAIMMRMILPSDIDTLDNFKRRTKQQIRRLRQSGNPTVLTVNGKPAVVVQDSAAYEAQMRRLAEFDFVAAVNDGAADCDAGRMTEANAFFKQLRREKVRRK